MPHPHHHPPRGPHGAQWFVSVEDSVTRAEFAEQLQAIGSILQNSATLEINGRLVTMPDDVESVVRFERTPHGTLALVIHAEWEEFTEGLHAAPSRRLQIRAGNVEAGG